MTFPLPRLSSCALALLISAGCASGGGGGGDTEAAAPQLSGAYRLDTEINFSRGAQEIVGTITFQDESFMTFVSDLDRTNVPAPCRYYVRGPRIESECEGYQFTFRTNDDGRIRVDIRQQVRGGQGTGIGFLVRM